MNSLDVYKKADRLVRLAGSRDPLRIARYLGIKIYYNDFLEELLGMYVCKWKHRIIILNNRLEDRLQQMVIAHELGHDLLHRQIASEGAMREFSPHSVGETEYEANDVAAHILIDTDEVSELAREGYGVEQISGELAVDMNLLLIKYKELIQLGYGLRLPYDADSRFFLQDSGVKRDKRRILCYTINAWKHRRKKDGMSRGTAAGLDKADRRRDA